MPEGEVLHPFAPQRYLWDDLWLEQDGAAHFVVVARQYEKEQVAEAVLANSPDLDKHPECLRTYPPSHLPQAG